MSLYDGPREEPTPANWWAHRGSVVNTISRCRAFLVELPTRTMPAEIKESIGLSHRTLWNILRNALKFQLAYNFAEVGADWFALYDWDQENVISYDADGTIYLGPPRHRKKNLRFSLKNAEAATFVEIKEISDKAVNALAVLLEARAFDCPVKAKLSERQVEILQGYEDVVMREIADGTGIYMLI